MSDRGRAGESGGRSVGQHPIEPRATPLPFLLLFVPVFLGGALLVFIGLALITPMPETGSFGDMTARYDFTVLRYWLAAVLCFGFAFAFAGAAANFGGAGALVFLLGTALACATICEGCVWAAIHPGPGIVISRSGIDCWLDSTRWRAIRWSDIANTSYTYVSGGRRARVPAARLWLKPAAAAAVGGLPQDCWIGHLSDGDHAIYQAIRAAWQRGR